ncbi:MAG: DUF805 domain-containing protein [Candidatus Nomurabacteria bacterium]|nr:DUF805 domain-containing protein [Candidatus Nomurabacteria bacterium]
MKDLLGISEKHISGTKYFFVNLFLGIILSAVIGILYSLISNSSIVSILGVIAAIFIIYVSIKTSVKRLHQFGWSAWLLLLFIIPIVNCILWLILVFKDSTQRQNQQQEPMM